MNEQEIKAPIPVRNKVLAALKNERDGGPLPRARTPGFRSPPLKFQTDFRARSATPATPSYGSSYEDEAEYNLQQRLKFYNLDFPEEEKEYEKVIYDPKSKWFSRKIKPKFQVQNQLPYQTESHKEQAKYMTQVLVNLYIALSSLDIQGLISITSKDLADLKNEIDDLALKTDLFRLSNGQTPLEIDGKVRRFSEDELYNENDFISSQTADISTSGKITAKSSTIVNLNHWTNELRNCLSFNFPLSLRKSLVTVFYYLTLVQGQDIARDLFVDVFEILVDENDEDTNFLKLLKAENLVLDHTVLFEFICNFFPYPDSDYVKYDLSSKEDLKLFRILLRLAHYAKPFFNEKDENLLKGTMDILLGSFSPSTMSVVLPIMTSFVPLHYNKVCKITDYLPFCFSLWTSVSATVAVDTHLYEFVGDVADDVYMRLLENGTDSLSAFNVKFGKFGIFTEEQMTFMFNRLQGHLRSNAQIHSYTRTVQPFIYSLNGSENEEFFFKLSKLVKTIETFVHPSNSGFWTKPIAKFVHCFIKMYHRRVQYEKEQTEMGNIKGGELCLKKECNDRIVGLFFNILTTGAQNKNQDISNYYISCFSYLLDLECNKKHMIFDHVLEDIYDFLADEYVNSRHRVISSLKQLTRAARFLVSDKLYRVHVTNILSVLVTKIDPNDLTLTSQIINALVSTCCFVPICNMVPDDSFLTFESNTLPFVQQHYYYLKSKEQDEGCFEYDEAILSNAFIASTSEFKNILKVYIDKIFTLVDVELDEGFVVKINQTTMIMIESMNDDMFNYFSSLFQKTFWENDAFKVKDPNYELITIPLAALVRHYQNTSLSLVKLLIYNIKTQIEKGAGSIRSYSEVHQRDVKLVLYLTALNDVLRQAHSSILKISTELSDFIIYVYENISNPPLDVLTSILVHSILSSLTSTEITRCSLFSEENNIPLEERWGGLQNDIRLYDQINLNFKWHVPTKGEISFAVAFFENMSEYCIDKISSLISNPSNDKTYTDLIQKYILVLTHSLSGSSLLFDPDFNKNKSAISDISSYREKLYLLKQIRDKNCDNDELNVDIEQIRSEKDEDECLVDIQAPEAQYDDDAVVIPDEGNEGFMMDDSISEVPSAVGTPVPGQTGGASLMNANLVFRDLDIYTCNYFFGLSIEEKLSHPEYVQVHKIRSKIGLFIHKLFIFFSEQFENNTKLFQILLHGLKVWFTDVGKESLFAEDPTAFLDIDFVENIQSLSHKPDPFTRMYLAVKADTFHQNRVLLRSTNRYPSKLEIQLLNDIMVMATSVYPDIHQIGQATLAHCMKQLIGSYSIIIKQIMHQMEVVLKSENHKQLDVILRVMMVKKVRRKILNDYNNMEQLLFLLIRCSEIKEFEIGSHASNIIADFVSNIKIPSSVCLYDKHMLNLLSPNDVSIDLQVSAVKTAKEKKRAMYMDKLKKLQNSMLDFLEYSEDVTWKNIVSITRLVTKLESSLETTTNKRTLNVILSHMATNHPHIIQVTLRSILSIFNKFLSLSDYDYDIRRAYSSNFDPQFVQHIDSSSVNYSAEFKKEMCNFETPSYFIDSKAYVGWLCWGIPFKALTVEKYKLKFRSDEVEAIRVLSKNLSKPLLEHISSTLIKDNESRGAFSSGEVSFFILIMLLSESYQGVIKLEDTFDLCGKFYDRTDKASMIISLEIVAALISGSKYVSTSTVAKIDNFLDAFLTDCLDRELNQDAFEVWCTLCWWLPTVIDIRRSKSFCKHLFNIKGLLNTNFDDTTHQSCRLMLLKNVISSLEYRSFDRDAILNNLMFDHPYDQVRENVAKLFVTIIQTESYPSLESPGEVIKYFSSDSGLGLALKIVPKLLDDFIKRLFISTALEYKQVMNQSPQQILKTSYYYKASTLFYWIREMSKGPTKILLVPYIEPCVIPFLINLLNQKDVCKIAGLDPTKIFLNLADMPLRMPFIKSIIDLLCKVVPMSSSYQIRVQLTCIEYILSAQLLQLSESELSQIRDFVLYELYNENFVEVRMRAASLLSELIHNTGVDTQLLEKFNKNLPNCSWDEKQKLSKTDVKIHASILGIGAIISAFPYVFPLPKWIPKELAYISSWARTTGFVGTSAKNVISEFKKVRVDTWNFDRTVFTSEELEDLEGVLWRSYYA
ncbi:proteasome activator Blm10p [Monosporozyma unispora]